MQQHGTLADRIIVPIQVLSQGNGTEFKNLYS
jgi:hypothetical protein